MRLKLEVWYSVIRGCVMNIAGTYSAAEAVFSFDIMHPIVYNRSILISGRVLTMGRNYVVHSGKQPALARSFPMQVTETEKTVAVRVASVADFSALEAIPAGSEVTVEAIYCSMEFVQTLYAELRRRGLRVTATID